MMAILAFIGRFALTRAVTLAPAGSAREAWRDISRGER